MTHRRPRALVAVAAALTSVVGALLAPTAATARVNVPSRPGAAVPVASNTTTTVKTTRSAKATRTTKAARKVAPVPAKAAASSPFIGLGSAEDTIVASVVTDLDAFWRVELPKAFGVAFTPLKGYRAASATSLPPTCGRSVVTYDDIADNAFYCRGSDYVAWDDAGLFPELVKTYGQAAIAMVLAHETGHAMQARAGVKLPDVLMELQADCFAGAWFRHLTDNGSTTLRLETSALDDALGAILAFRDDPGTPADAADAHGNGFDRVTSFQLGYVSGTKRCARFSIDRPLVTATGFAGADAVTGGDVPLAEAIDLAVKTADAYFTKTVGLGPVTMTLLDSGDAMQSAFDKCADSFEVAGAVVVVCPSSSTVYADRTRLGQVYGAIRDAGVGYAIVLGWAALAERARHADVVATRPFTLAISCLAGSWLHAVANGADSSLSPGDLDEAIAAAIGLPPATVSGPETEVTAFDRISSLRAGYVSGLAACT